MNEIIDFSSYAAAAKLAKKEAGSGASDSYLAKQTAKRTEQLAKLSTNPNLTATGKNQRLRLDRRNVWRNARDLMQYRRARLDWHGALQYGQSHGVADANSFPSADEDSRFALVEKWRAALVKLTLTPAPDAAAVAWKRAQLRAENYRYAGVKPERIERAIAEDVAFLAAHPTKSNSEGMARRREFNEAMRQRIREVAASRDLSDEEIGPALTLRHHEIANFTEKHGVNLEWLLAPLQ